MLVYQRVTKKKLGGFMGNKGVDVFFSGPSGDLNWKITSVQ